MRAAWYERGGPAGEVMTVGEMEDLRPEAGEVLVRVYASGVNPGEAKKRSDCMGYGIGYPRVIPHSDGAGTIEEVGEGVSYSRVGQRVWVWGAQSGRPFGTAAQYVALPNEQAVPLPTGVGFEVGACLGIPARTATAASSPTGPSRARRCSSPAERGRWAASPSRSRSGEGRR
jgi:NADPH:quinone reductase